MEIIILIIMGILLIALGNSLTASVFRNNLLEQITIAFGMATKLAGQTMIVISVFLILMLARVLFQQLVISTLLIGN